MGDIDDFDDDNDVETEGKNPLRAVVKAKDKLLKELESELKELRAGKRKSSVASLLKEAGADPEYAEFYTSEDASEDAVKAWIQSKSRLLNIQPVDDDIDPEAAAAAARISGAAANAPQRKIGSLEDKAAAIRNAKTPEEYQAALANAGLAPTS